MGAKQSRPHNGQRQQSKETNLLPLYSQTVDKPTPFLRQDGLQVTKSPSPPIGSETQSVPEKGQRHKSTETNLPPPYPQTVDENTPFLQQDGLQVIKAPLPPIVSATLAATSTTSQPTELSASQVWGEALADPKARVGTTEITTELTPRRHEATELQRMTIELQNIVHKAVYEALADPKARVGTTETTTELTPKRHKATDSQRRIIEAQKRTIELQKETIKEQRSIIEYQNATREAQKTMIGCKDRYIDYLRQKLQSVSAKVAAAEALPEKEQEEALSDLRRQLHRRQDAEVHVSEVVHELLDILKTRDPTLATVIRRLILSRTVLENRKARAAELVEL